MHSTAQIKSEMVIDVVLFYFEKLMNPTLALTHIIMIKKHSRAQQRNDLKTPI